MKEIIGEYAVVSKVNVKNLEASLEWYQSKLGLRYDPRYTTPTWGQLLVQPNLAVGLNKEEPTGTGEAVFTFVVEEIEVAKQQLESKGVQVGDIINVDKGVKLAFFQDIDGNSLGLRENAPVHPSVKEFNNVSEHNPVA